VSGETKNIKMYYVYVLKSQIRNKRYIGYSTDLKKRLVYHSSRKVKSTKAYKPWKIVFYEAFDNEQDTRAEEKLLKTGQWRRILKTKLKHTK
jgi:putative endonuclease